MRRGQRNRWTYDSDPNGGTTRNIPRGMVVVTDGGKWHHEPGRNKNERSSATERKLREFGWIK